jgi:predicted metal-dependent hydrolase
MITINTQLVEYPIECLESVVVHELCHLLEPSHNARFHRLLDAYYPANREARKILNATPPRR